ncbi:MAG TPA: hypothetical protein VFD52_07900 [Clostridia bacterium]|nr:hypothetical protein [Clostridia bacterium]
MSYYKIAGLNISYRSKCDLIINRSEKYKTEKFENADICADVSEEEIKSLLERAPNLTEAEAEYLLIGASIYTQLINFGGFFLHSSAVSVDGEAYLFSAPCGTGKSTHTQMWQKYFGEDSAQIINDDKPAIRIIDGQAVVFGTPFSGKTSLNLNTSVPLKSICFIERSKENWIKPLTNAKAVVEILNQTIRPKEIEQMDKLLSMIEKVLNSIKVYKMGCNISEQAVKLSYNTMKYGFERQT